MSEPVRVAAAELWHSGNAPAEIDVSLSIITIDDKLIRGTACNPRMLRSKPSSLHLLSFRHGGPAGTIKLVTKEN